MCVYECVCVCVCVCGYVDTDGVDRLLSTMQPVKGIVNVSVD